MLPPYAFGAASFQVYPAEGGAGDTGSIPVTRSKPFFLKPLMS